MKHEFVTYKIAKELKKLDFNENCLAFYFGEELRIEKCNGGENRNCIFSNAFLIASPLWQQVRNWLLKKHKINITIMHGVLSENFSYEIYFLDNMDLYEDSEFIYLSYLDAQESAIIKSIELIKKIKQDGNNNFIN